MNIVQVAQDKNLAGPWFQGESWEARFAFLATVFGLPLTEAQQALFKRFTGREVLPPLVPFPKHGQWWVGVAERAL